VPTLRGRRPTGTSVRLPGLALAAVSATTEPLTHGAPGAGPSFSARDPLGTRLAARFEALAARVGRSRALVAAGLLGLGVFLARPTFPNYDSYYDLVWGKALSHGRLPDYNVLRSPTPHPLAEAVGAFLTLFGGAADRIFVLITIFCFLGLLVCVFRITQLLLGSLIAGVAVLVLLTRVDLDFYAMRAVVDIPFLLLLFWAALLELKSPRRGLPVLGLLALAGLLRPEAWVFSGVYVLWLAPKLSRREFVGYAAFAALAPVIWAASDWIVTGHPLHSLTSTRQVAGQFGRQRSVPKAISLIPDYLGANDKIMNVGAGGLGCLLAIYLLRRRIALPAALMGIGLGMFLVIAAAGLSVIPRYVAVPSILFNVGVAVALFGWTLVSDRRARRAAIGLALVSLALVAWRAHDLFNDGKQLSQQTLFVKHQHRDLKAILQDPAVAPLLGRCDPVTVPTHSAIPVIEYETGLPKSAIQASIAQSGPPDHGLLLIGVSFNFEPAAQRSVTASSQSSARRWWSNYPLSTFKEIASNPYWTAYARCPGAAAAG
jgi:hypothetical protein